MTELFAGRHGDLSGSMAEAMLAAMDEALAEAGRPATTDSARPGMQIMFLAIANGVLHHLKENEQALAVTLPATNERLAVTVATRA